ncbi:LamG-like jellyroll fold domain-containing protein [Rhodoferax sp.]|uniref:LamG-like jellyroll fold domain-containing protein n=1 Tax=Rhodoferax sp. TaxID=50421 RepID=UPI0025D6D3E5|nr:LamG-like jellyroll fold domain-containing protein [Rhodoferax sp.]
MKQRIKTHMAAGCLAVASLLAGCGGGETSAAATVPGSELAASNLNQGLSSTKTLVVEIDGVDFEALREAITQHRVPALASLQVAPAWTGGSNGTLSEQRVSGGPGWASLVTGTWANRHGVHWDTDDQRINTKAPTVFAAVRAKSAELKTAAVTSNSAYQSMLATDIQTGAIDAAVDCAGADECVTERTNQLLLAGYDLLVAQYSAPAAAAANNGLRGGAYQKALADTSSAVGKLLATIARRTTNDPSEDWQVIITTGYGLDAFGTASGLQTAANKTIFIASNKPLDGLPAVGTDAPTEDKLQMLAAATDIAPTVLRQLGISPAPTEYGFNGMALQSATSLRSLTATTGTDKTSINLTWTLAGRKAQPVQVLRDGQLIATLAVDATAYSDAVQAASDGTYVYRYTVVAGEASVSLTAQIAYVKPATLAPTLVNGLLNYYPLDALPAVDVKVASTLVPWAMDANGGTLITDDSFNATYRTKALRIDSAVKNSSGMAGYRLQQTNDVTTDPAATAFTIGFWVRTDATCSQGVSNGATVIGNKNYTSGINAGLAIGLFGSCEIRFNVGTGSARADSNGYGLSAGQWAYVAVVIDKANLKMTGYVFDPVKGAQTGSVVLTAALIGKLGGLNNGFGLNEDGTGLYYQRETSSPRGAMDFNDFAIWSRELTGDELASVYKAAQPLSSLNP